MEEELKKRIKELEERADNIYGNSDLRGEILEKIEILEKFKDAMYGF